MIDKVILAQSFKTKNGTLDDDYTLYDDGEVLHEYDRSIYPGGFNLKETLRSEDLSDTIKERLLSEAKDEHRVLVTKLLYVKDGI